MLWVIGTVVWVVLIWAVAEVLAATRRRWRQGDRSRTRTTVPTASWALPLAGLALIVVAVIAGLRPLVPAASAGVTGGRVDRAVDAGIARSVERRARPGPVIVVVRPMTFESPSSPRHPTLGYYVVDDWGVAMLLLGAGWQPGLPQSFDGVATHLSVPPGSRWPEVVVHIDPSTFAVTAVRQVEAPARS